MLRKVFQSIIIFIFLLALFSNSINAGLIIDYCDSCHTKLIEKGNFHEIHTQKKRYSCDKCHISEGKVVRFKISCGTCHYMEASLAIPHKNICRFCHTDTIHTIHVVKECVLCHIKPAKPSSECTSCHRNDLHEIHSQVRNRICTNCHGDVGKAYANKTTPTIPSVKPEKYEKIPHGLSTLKSIISSDYWIKTLSVIDKFITQCFKD